MTIVVLVLLAVIVIAGGKYLAGRAADTAMDERAAQMQDLLDGASPEDFMAFGAAVRPTARWPSGCATPTGSST